MSSVKVVSQAVTSEHRNFTPAAQERLKHFDEEAFVDCLLVIADEEFPAQTPLMWHKVLQLAVHVCLNATTLSCTPFSERWSVIVPGPDTQKRNPKVVQTNGTPKKKNADKGVCHVLWGSRYAFSKNMLAAVYTEQFLKGAVGALRKLPPVFGIPTSYQLCSGSPDRLGCRTDTPHWWHEGSMGELQESRMI